MDKYMDLMTQLFKIVKTQHTYTTKIAEQQKAHAEYMAKRFDDIDKRLCVLELKMDASDKKTQESFRTIHRDTQLLPDIFNMLHDDGNNIAHLQEMLAKMKN